MIISKNTWHYRVFNWQYEQSHYGRSLEDDRTHERTLWAEYDSGRSIIRYDRELDLSFNLCPYVRAIVIKAPFRWLFTPPRLWFTLVALYLIGLEIVHHFKGVAGVKEVLAWTIGAALTVGIITVMGMTAEFIKTRARSKVPGVVVSFLEVLSERAEAAHKGICPRITFTDKG